MINMPKQEIQILIKNGNKSMFDSIEEMQEFIEEIFSANEREDIVLYGNSGGGRQKSLNSYNKIFHILLILKIMKW